MKSISLAELKRLHATRCNGKMESIGEHIMHNPQTQESRGMVYECIRCESGVWIERSDSKQAWRITNVYGFRKPSPGTV